MRILLATTSGAAVRRVPAEPEFRATARRMADEIAALPPASTLLDR